MIYFIIIIIIIIIYFCIHSGNKTNKQETRITTVTNMNSSDFVEFCFPECSYTKEQKEYIKEHGYSPAPMCTCNHVFNRHYDDMFGNGDCMDCGCGNFNKK